MRAVIIFAGYVPLAIFLADCGGDPVEIPPPAEFHGNGGTGSGGSAGTPPTGGNVGQSGTFGQGGKGGTGTAGASAGVQGVGGATAGASGKGGAGGTPPTAGAGPAAGKGGTGSAGTGTSGASTAGTSSAGTSSAGGSSVSCDATFMIGSNGFVRAPAVMGGCWHGYASAGGDTGSTVTPEEFAACGAGCMLNSSGTVGPANMTNDYVGSVYIGFNTNEPASGGAKATVTPAGSGLVFTFTNTGTSTTVRAQISSGSAASTRWCATATSGTVIPYAMFNTTCWDTTLPDAAPYAKQAIDTVQMVIPGAEEATTFDITITSIKEM